MGGDIHRFNAQRLLCAVLLLTLLGGEVAIKPSSLITLGALALVLSALILYEASHFAELRERVRHQLTQESPSQ